MNVVGLAVFDQPRSWKTGVYLTFFDDRMYSGRRNESLRLWNRKI